MSLERRQTPDRRGPGREGGRRQTDPQQEWVSISDYARIYGIDRATVYKWLRADLLVVYQVGTLRRLRNLPPQARERVEGC